MCRQLTCACCFSLASRTIFMYISNGFSPLDSSLPSSASCFGSSSMSPFISVSSSSCPGCSLSCESCLGTDTVNIHFTEEIRKRSFRRTLMHDNHYHLPLQSLKFLQLSFSSFLLFPLPLFLSFLSFSFPPLLLILFIIPHARFMQGLWDFCKTNWMMWVKSAVNSWRDLDRLMVYSRDGRPCHLGSIEIMCQKTTHPLGSASLLGSLGDLVGGGQ